MADYLTDDEQVERIKKWWSDNGSSVIAGLIIGVGGLAGWRFWNEYRTNQAAEASAHFTNITTALQGNQNDKVIEQANIILDDYSSTAYADLARLSLAKAYVEEKEYAKAEQQLSFVVDGSKERSLVMVARKRLAEVLYQQQKYDEAFKVLNIDYPSQFAAGFEEMKGDILAAQGKTQDARDAYQKARLAQPAAANPEFLQQKLDDLGLPTADS
jgi:predicted negative regulator of RcsB-dependent stress response